MSVRPTFHGPMSAEFDAFTELMLSTGGRHVTLLRVIARLDQYLARCHPGMATLTKAILRQWFQTFEHLSPSAQKRYRTAAFQLCKYLRRRNPSSATRDDFLSVRLTSTFRPHIFSVEEIGALLSAARQLRPKPSEPLRPWSFELIIALLYTCGLRISEVVRLEVRDYDASNGCLVVRETKFAKTRLIPLSSSTRLVVEAYLDRRRALDLGCDPGSPLRCCPCNHPPSIGSVQAALAGLMRSCGIKPARGRGVRIHDLRHTFAVHRVLQWYREGIDVQAALPQLVTYMGHRELASTQRYLELTPAVLHHAAGRFAKYSESKRRKQNA